MKKGIILALICLFGMFAFEVQAAGKIVLKISSLNASSHPFSRALIEKFKPMVEESSKGRIDVQIFPDGQLGNERETIEQVQTGLVEMSYFSPVLGTIDPAVNVTDLPYLFKDEAHVDKALDSPILFELLKDLPAKGFVPLGFMENGFRVTSNSKRPINTVEDFKGLKIRTPEAPLSLAIFKAFGANVTPMTFGELFSALQQGVVDGQENAYNTLTSSRFFEVQKYVTETNHMYGCVTIVANAKFWNSLDKEMQDVVAAAAKATSRYQRDIFRQETADSKKMVLDAGLQIATPDLASFEKAVQPVWEDFFKTYPQFKPVVEQIQQLR